MDKLKKLAIEYFNIEGKCDGQSKTFAELHPLAKDLKTRVKILSDKSRSQVVRYFAWKLYQDVSEMETRFWKYTWME